MINDAERTVLEFRRKVLDAEAVERAAKEAHSNAVRAVKDARKMFDRLLDEMVSPQIPLPFGAVPVPAGGNGEGYDHAKARDDMKAGVNVNPVPAFAPLPDDEPDEDEHHAGPDALPAEPEADGEDDWKELGIEVLDDHGITAMDKRMLTKHGLITFGRLVEFVAGGDGSLASIPGLGPKAQERVSAAINSWLEANPA